MNWYFIRHGQIDSNMKKVYSGRSDEPLNEVGREQVRQASRNLVNIGIDAIYCSPLVRTRQTAEIIVHELDWDLSVHLDESFNEMKMGPWEGLTEAEVESGFPEHWATWNTAPADLRLDGRETLADLQRRVLGGMREIKQADSAASVLIVTHVAVIRVINLFANGFDLNAYKSVSVDNASIYNFPKLSV